MLAASVGLVRQGRSPCEEVKENVDDIYQNIAHIDDNRNIDVKILKVANYSIENHGRRTAYGGYPGPNPEPCDLQAGA